MKIIVLSFLFSSLAMAVDCNQVSDDLLVLENKILNSSMLKCGSEQASPEPYCCNPEKPYSCKTRRQLELEYNQNVGKLIIAEGLLALGMAIESNHNALVSISSSKINEIKNYAQELDKNIHKADLLFKAMEIPAGTSASMWKDYRGTTRQEMSVFVADLCISEQYKDSAFCQKVNANSMADEPDSDLHVAWMEALNGFMNADKRSEPIESDRDRMERFATFQEKISIKSDDELLSPQQYLESDTYSKVRQLETKLSLYQQKRQEEDNPEEAARIASDILQISNELNQIQVNYAQTSTSSATVGRYLSDKFDKIMGQLDMPDLILSGPSKQNFQQTHKMFANDLKRFELSVNKKLEALLYTERDRKLENGRTIQDVCQDKFNSQCLLKVCGDNRCQNESIQELGLNDFLQEVEEVQQQKKLVKNLQEIEACFKTDEPVVTKRQCVRGLADDANALSQSQIDQLREKIKGIDYLISQQNNTQPFKNLNLEKRMAVNLLQSNKCQNIEEENLMINRAYCRKAPAGSDISFGNERNIKSEVLKLVSAGEEIIINLNHSEIRKSMQDNSVFVEDKDRERLKQMCQNDQLSSQSVCQYFRDKAAHRAEIAAYQAKLKLQREKQRAEDREELRLQRLREEDEPSFSGEFFKAAGTSALLWSPMLIGTLAERQMVKDQTRYQRNAIIQYDNWYMENLPAWQSYYDNMSPYSVTNWGYPQNTAYTFDASTSFQSANVNTNFSNNSGLQFSYTPIPTVIDTSVNPIPSGQTDTFGFGF
jgi:hypothetical protein